MTRQNDTADRKQPVRRGETVWASWHAEDTLLLPEQMCERMTGDGP